MIESLHASANRCWALPTGCSRRQLPAARCRLSRQSGYFTIRRSMETSRALRDSGNDHSVWLRVLVALSSVARSAMSIKQSQRRRKALGELSRSTMRRRSCLAFALVFGS